ncbi:N-6 DNA methylase [Polynucleobacter sp. Ross1-W9]|uniref:restriction endonuclease subunit M n=1 Tax=Polynucleobacter parvulilacunae TaxID=1855631 RepID=UPI001C0BD081|nr:N-6 DNA methylase [Polynucleobacter parvulilacunae]MBU3557432.1 N-6 DNA methylase [Polynucleobacter parvulilacunae]
MALKIAEILNQDVSFLKLFSKQQIDAVEASLIVDESSGRVYITCLKRQKKIQVLSKSKSNPEEIIRQLYLHKLIEEYGYSLNNMELEVPVKMGSATKMADVVIYENPDRKTKESIVLIVEVKKPDEDLVEGIGQLESYISALPTFLGVWVDGNEENVRYRNPENKYKFERFKRVPKSNETADDVLSTYLKKPDLIEIKDLRSTVSMLEQKVLSNDGVNAFDEIFKLIFAKLYDEQSKKPKDELDFQIKKGSKLKQSVGELFKGAKNKWPDVFKEKEEIELSEETLIAVVSELQEYKLFETDFEILDAAFEHMISGDSKGEKGQYFTPRPVIDIVVSMLNPADDEKVLDPSAGSAGFLLHTFQHMLKTEKIEERDRFRYASKNLYALDFDPRTVKIAKALMVIAGDGSSNSQQANSLDLRVWDKNETGIYDGVIAKTFANEGFDILMSNPPFAGEITSGAILGYYDVAKDGKNKTRSSEKRDVLFLERNLKFLKPGGRMAIILPQGRFNNSSDKLLREYISNKCRILAVVGLHGNSFKPYTGTKTSILIIQKWDKEKCPIKEDYPIFFATNLKPVKDNSGNYVGKSTQDTLSKTDLSAISEAFMEFSRKEKLSFFQ